MGTYDTRGGHPLHDPMFDIDTTTDLQERVLMVLEEAGVDTPICDQIVSLIEGWENSRIDAKVTES